MSLIMKPINQAFRWLKNHPRAVGVALVVALAGGVMLVITHTWWDEIADALARTNVYLFFALFCVLPLGGVSIALLYVVVGARFGGPVALGIVAAATAVHLAGSHLIARSFLRQPVERMLRRRQYRLPELARSQPVAFSLLGALVPGIPYAARNYLLALSGVPFRIYASICEPVYVIRSAAAIYLGNWAGDLSATRIAILAGVLAVKLGLCAAIVWYLRHKHGVTRTGHAVAARRPRTA